MSTMVPRNTHTNGTSGFGSPRSPYQPKSTERTKRAPMASERENIHTPPGTSQATYGTIASTTSCDTAALQKTAAGTLHPKKSNTKPKA
ncbi:MAG: hypothetical protein KKD69_06575 [Euryarchaeota archaeon]|nr:hypothetical protein [Euryarchaeota archaeon]